MLRATRMAPLILSSLRLSVPALALLWAIPAVAQTTRRIAPVASVTWAQIVAQDSRARHALRRGQPRAIPRMPLPPDREIGAPVGGPAALAQDAGPAPAAAVLAGGFVALEDNGLTIPPDTHGAVGPHHLVTMLNTQVRVQDKTGAVASTVLLQAFWMTAHTVFDPRVIYDRNSGRWMATVDANGRRATSRVLFAISATDDPTGTWNIYEFVADPSGQTWADFPGFGVNDRWVAITNNMYTVESESQFVAAKLWVIDKQSALDGGDIVMTEFPAGFDSAGGFSGAVLQPAVTIGGESRLYCVDGSGVTAGGVQLLRLSRLSGTGPAPAWSAVPGSSFAGSGLFAVPRNFSRQQIPAPQAGSSALIDSGDTRMSGLVVFRDGHLWAAHTGGHPVDGVDRTNIYWYELDPAAMPNPIVQSGVINGGPGVHHLFPSLAVNGARAAVIGFSRADASRFVEAVFTGRRASDPAGAMAPLQVLKAGEGPYAKRATGAKVRWGDYSATAVDPSQDGVFWTVQEYAEQPVGAGAEDSRWGTWWGRVEIAGPTATPTRTGTSTRTASRTATPSVTLSPTRTRTPTRTHTGNPQPTTPQATATPSRSSAVTASRTPSPTPSRTGAVSPTTPAPTATATVSNASSSLSTSVLCAGGVAAQSRAAGAVVSAALGQAAPIGMSAGATLTNRAGVWPVFAAIDAVGAGTPTRTPSGGVTAPRTATATRTHTRTTTAAVTAPATITPLGGTPLATHTATRSANVATATRTATPRPTGAPPVQCVGDCDRSRTVRVNELITGVNIALGLRVLGDCLAFDGNDNGRVTIDELLRAVNNALSGCSNRDIVLQIIPGAVLLDRDQSTATLRVQAFDRAGNDVSLDTVAIEWLSSDDQVVRVVPDAGDPTTATATVLQSIGTAMVTTRLTTDPDVVAPLVAVTRAKLHPEVALVPDEDVVFPPPNLPDGVSLRADRIADFVPATAGGEAQFGGFTESELAELFEMTDAFRVSYPVVLRGPSPALGQRLLASGGAAISGVVVSVEQAGNFTLVQLEVAPPQELFEALDFSLSAEQLLADGLLMPFDTSGWETDDGRGSTAGDEAGVGIGAQVEIPVGPFVCKPIGLGILPNFTQTPIGSHTYFGPIWDGALRIDVFELEYFYFKAGLQARALFNPEIRLSNGVSVEAVCDLKDELRINQKLPVTGPMAVLLAPYVEGLVSIPFKVGLSGGATSRYGMKLGFDYALWTGGTYTPDAGWQALCETWGDCSRTNQEAELVWDEDRSGNQMTIEGEAGLFLAGDAGIQAGGIIFDVARKIPGLGTILSGATKALEQKGKVPILRARLGPQGVIRWHNASRTAFIEASEAAGNLVVQGDLNVRFDALNSYLRTALRLTGARSIPLLTFPLFHFGEPYRVLNEETLTVNGTRISSSPFAPPVEVRVGDTVSVVSTVERDFLNLTLIELFLTSVSLHQDFPHQGAIWVDGTSIAAMTATNEFTLSGSFQATQALCDDAATGEGSVEVKLLAFNRMFSLIPTANFVGSFTLMCNEEDNQAPAVDAGADQVIALPATAALNGTVSDDGKPDPPGMIILTWSKVSGPGTVVFANPAAADTTASFSQAGAYALELAASDGEVTVRDIVTITVTDRPASTSTPTRTATAAVTRVLTATPTRPPAGNALAYIGLGAVKNELQVVDTSTNQVVDVIPLVAAGSVRDVEVTADGRLVYAKVDRSTAFVDVLDAVTRQPLVSIPVCRNTTSFEIALRRDGAFLYVACFDDRIDVIRTATNAVETSISLRDGPRFVAMAPLGALAYAILSGDNDNVIIDNATHAVLRTIDGFDLGDAAAAFSPDGTLAYVLQTHAVTIRTAATGAFVAQIHIDNPDSLSPADLVVTPNGRKAYASFYDPSKRGRLIAMDIVARQVLKVLEFQQPTWRLALTPDGGRLYATGRVARTAVQVLSTTTDAVVDAIALPEAGGIAIAPAP